MKSQICGNEASDYKDFEYAICEECFWEYTLIQVANPYVLR